MSRTIITNGDHAAHALAAHFPDAEILIWRDVLVEGPVPGGIDGNTLSDIRAKHIESAFGLKDVRADIARRDNAFASIKPTARVELWFETDLHDQLQILQVLDRFNSSTVWPPLFLTQSPPPLISNIDEMARTFSELDEEALQAAANLWAAFCASDPLPMASLANEKGALPDARNALARLLQEFPSTRNGLGRIERNALLAIKAGAIAPALAFRHYQASEELPFLGDLGFFHRLDALAFCRYPLLTGLPQGGISEASRKNQLLEYSHASLELTQIGERILAAEEDMVAVNGLNRWIGGVHLTPHSVWRYDEAKQSIARV